MLFPYLSRQASHLQKQKLSRKSRAQRSLILTQQKGATSGWLKGKVSRGVLEKGPAGFCLVRFEDEPFPSEVPTCGLLRRLQSQGPSSRGFEPLARARAKARASRLRALLLHQLLKKLQQILKAILGRKLALWRAAEPIPAETSSASKKILLGVHDITGLPVEAQPPEGCKRQHSYTVKLDDGAISIDVLCRSKGFFVKKPEKCRVQFSWSLYDKPADAWYACVGACEADLN